VIAMSCPTGTALVAGVTTDDVKSFSYGYHVIIAVALFVDVLGIGVYACSKRDLSTDAGRQQRRRGIWARVGFFVVLALVIALYVLLANGGASAWPAGDAFQAPLLVIAALLVLHAATEASLVYGVHASRYAPDALSAFSDFSVAYVGIVYATRPQVATSRSIDAAALWVGFAFVAYALFALAFALAPFQRPYASKAEYLSHIKSLTLLIAAIVLVAVQDPSSFDVANAPPSTVCSRPYVEQAEFSLHIGLVALAFVQALAASANACTGCCYDDTRFHDDAARLVERVVDEGASSTTTAKRRFANTRAREAFERALNNE